MLVNRGIPYNEIYHYTHLTEKDNLSCDLLKNIDKAAEMLLKHINAQDEIYFIIDSDCDGYTAGATLINYITEVFPNMKDHISYSFHEGKKHGINLMAVPTSAKLVIAADSSSNDYVIHQQLHNCGIDVLVLDHHIAEKESENACVVNNQLCDYPNKSLSGVGVVYKFCQKLDKILHMHCADNQLDLVMLGLIGDVMDLRSFETRYLCELGMHQVCNPFISSMAEKNAFSLKGELTPIGVAFYIVPLVNAITRVGSMEEKELLFKSMLYSEAYKEVPSTKRGCKSQIETIVEQAVRVCTNVKNRQTKVRDNAVETIERVINEQNLLSKKILIVRMPEGFADKSVLGLIANELMNKYRRPTMLLTKSGNSWAGSARGIILADFRKLCEDSHLVDYAQGHPSAFGVSVPDNLFPQFQDWIEDQVKDIEFSPNYKVDFIFHATDSEMVKAIFELGDCRHLWAQCVDEPLIAIENVCVTKNMITLLSRDKNPTIKIQLPNGVSCIKFKSSEAEY